MTGSQDATIQIGELRLTAPARAVARALLADVLNGDRDEPIRVTGIAPPIGSVWPGQGGINAGLIRSEAGQPDHYIIVPTHEYAAFEGAWGPFGKVAGAMSVYDGLGNTRAMAEAGSDIAKRALQVVVDGHSDLYIPARGEARICAVNVPELFNKDRWHWTSTQCGSHDEFAWVQTFGGGGQGNHHKSDEGLVRLVRKVILR